MQPWKAENWIIKIPDNLIMKNTGDNERGETEATGDKTA